MTSPSKPIRYLFLAIVCLAASCQGRHLQDQASNSVACPPGPVPADLTQTVRAQFAPMTLRLPDGPFRSRNFVDEIGRGQAWTGSSGLVVSYTVQADPPKLRDVSRGDHDVVNCSEQIGGRPAVIRMLYSEATTAPGQRVVAVWSLADGESLVITAYHPDRRQRDELLGIVRSVQFGPA